MKTQSEQTKNKTLTNTEIIAVIKQAAESSYGVMGISQRTNKKGKQEDDITISKDNEGKFIVNVHVIVAPNIKITEIVRSCQKTIKNRFEAISPKSVKAVDIIVEDILG